MSAFSMVKRLFCALVLSLLPLSASAENTLVAVATNFAEAIDALVTDFESVYDHEITIVTGSTGKLYAQISNGAPFEILLAADQERPSKLVDDGIAIPDSQFTFAKGRLVLWSIDVSRIKENGIDTVAQDFRRFAIANPALAPYGAAAVEALSSLNLYDTVSDRIVMGENIGQTHALIASGNAEIGIVALSYAISPRNAAPGKFWLIPSEHYSPIRQDAVLLRSAQDNPAALAFLDYLRSDSAITIIREHGYEIE